MEDSFAMNGGDGPTSYTHNSKYQGTQSDQAKVLLTSSIRKHLVLPTNSDCTSNRVFRIADLGCSVGPNTFASIDTIIGSVISEYEAKHLDSEILEFQVFFNDQVSNDFNTLFQNLPPERLYMAAGVPGSFHGRLFPESSVNLFHSAFALHWLPGVPEEVKSPASPAWNGGKVTYAESAPEVAEAYEARFRKDIGAFFKERSTEMVDNGLLGILMPCRPEGTAPSCSVLMAGFECVGHALVDMAKEGLIEEALVDSFNLPIFSPTASEVTEVISETDCLRAVAVEEIPYPKQLSTSQDIGMCCLHLRAIFEDLLRQHFDLATSDLLFQRLSPKIEEFSRSVSFTNAEKLENLFLLIKKVPASSRYV